MRPSPPSLVKLLVPIKRSIDYAVKTRVNASQTAVETDGVKHSIGPFDEIAVEEAVRLREKHGDTIENIAVVTIGPSKATDVLRTSLALGADTAFHIPVGDKDPMPEPLAVAKCLKALVDKEKPDLIIMGKQSIDGDNSQTGAMLAGLLNWPQANFASKVELDGDKLEVAREIDGGIETLKLSLPALVTTDLRLNEPRLAKLPNIMKARKKPITVLKPDELGVDLKPRLETLKVTEPPTRTGGGKAESVEDMVAQLKSKGVI